MDESPKQVIDYKAFIGKDGTQYQDSEYIRKGVVELSISTQSLVGFRQLTVEDDHKASTWVLFIANLMDTIYKDAIKVTAVIVMVIPNNILLIFKRHFLVFGRILQSYPHKEFDFLLLL